jgi:membrane dipeptidase
MSENAPLLPSSADSPPLAGQQRKRPARTILVVLALIGACIFVGIKGENGLLPKSPMKRAQYFLSNSPVIDGHVDLPELARVMYGNNVDKFDLRKKTVSHVHFSSNQPHPFFALST